jgi:bifunctional non-homologous end joining protein LigD
MKIATASEGARRVPANALVLDGEIISAGPDGCPDFSALQDDLKQGRHDRFVYYAFDLLHLDGLDTRSAPLADRKRASPITTPRTASAFCAPKRAGIMMS